METQIISVSQLTLAISRVLEANLGTLSVQGEISNYKAHSSGHRYFTLKDEGAQISCVMWKSRTLSFIPKDGMKVIITGKITVYPLRGNYQIECYSIKPLGQGDLYMAFEALKEKLESKGYFEKSRKRPLPLIPMKIGVSTSPTGAAVKDIISTIERRMPACRIYFRPTLVQGDGSAEDIVKAIRELNKLPLDIIIIGRGGGSIEDLWSYNEEITANAIYNSKIPVISAVGHETDFTIADFVADHRAPTPTGAAELVTSFTKENLLQILDKANNILTSSINRFIKDYNIKIDNTANSYVFRSIKDKIKNNIQWLDENENRIAGSILDSIKFFENKVQSLESHCRSLYPLSPLNKGFALLQTQGRFINKDETLGNFFNIDIIRIDEIAEVTVNKVDKKIKLNKNILA